MTYQTQCIPRTDRIYSLSKTQFEAHNLNCQKRNTGIRLLQSVVLLAAIVAVLMAASLPIWAQTDDGSIPAPVAATRSALVRIHVVSTQYDQGREQKQESYGSGAIISPDGYVVTNHHVVADAEYVVCTLTDKRVLEAKVIGTDPLADIAVIKLPQNPAVPYPSASFGDSSALKVGDTIFAMGSPLSISQSVTEGIISNVEMVMPEMFMDESLKLEGEDVGSIVLWIGHDALIEPGNSGGPLVDKNGKVVGINEISLGLSGAIPSNLAQKISSEIIINGKVNRSWLGIQLQPLLKSSNQANGCLISDITAGTPAAAAGIQAGDILLAVDDQPTNAPFREQIPAINQMIYSMPIGKTVQIKILRDGKEQTLTAATTERPRAEEKEHELKSWGICASNISYYVQKEMQLKSQDGVVVQSILPSGPAGSAKPALSEDDIIIRVGGNAVKDLNELRNISKKLTDNIKGQTPVLVEFLREKNQYATVVKLGKADEPESGEEISKAWLSVESQPLTKDLAKALALTNKTGVRITRVFPDSNASKAGLQTGDVILKLDNEQIPAEEPEDVEVFSSMIRQYEIGSKVKLRIVRDKKPLDITVELVAAPKPEDDYKKYEDDTLEFQARDIAFADRSKGKVTGDSAGVYVTSVSSGGWAALAHLQTSDVITTINGESTGDLEKLKTVLANITKSKPEYVVFRVRRGIHTIYLEVKPEWPE